ncbi:hypothetical protein ACM66B_002344 [Microbotryomycetes sp. NB124-2]
MTTNRSVDLAKPASGIAQGSQHWSSRNAVLDWQLSRERLILSHHDTAFWAHDGVEQIFDRTPTLEVYDWDGEFNIIVSRLVVRILDPRVPRHELRPALDGPEPDERREAADRLSRLYAMIGGRTGDKPRRVHRLESHPRLLEKTRGGLPSKIGKILNNRNKILSKLLPAGLDPRHATPAQINEAFENTIVMALDPGLKNAIGSTIFAGTRHGYRGQRDSILRSAGLEEHRQQAQKATKQADESFEFECDDPKVSEFVNQVHGQNRRARRRRDRARRQRKKLGERWAAQLCAQAGLFATDDDGRETTHASHFSPESVKWSNLSTTEKLTVWLIIGEGYDSRRGGGRNPAYANALIRELIKQLEALSRTKGFTLIISRGDEFRSSRVCCQRDCNDADGSRSWVDHCVELPYETDSWSVLECSRCHRIYQRDRLAACNIIFIAWHQLVFGTHPFKVAAEQVAQAA